MIPSRVQDRRPGQVRDVLAGTWGPRVPINAAVMVREGDMYSWGALIARRKTGPF